MAHAFTAVDVDKEAAVAELERLIGALKNDEAFLQGLDHEEHAAVGEDSTESVTVEYIVTDEFDGIDPINHDDGRGE